MLTCSSRLAARLGRMVVVLLSRVASKFSSPHIEHERVRMSRVFVGFFVALHLILIIRFGSSSGV